MTVVAYDPYVSRGSEIAVGVDRVESLKGLLAASDVVSLHCPLTEETREMIDAATARADEARCDPHQHRARRNRRHPGASRRAPRRRPSPAPASTCCPSSRRPTRRCLRLAYRNRADPIVGDRLIVTPHAAWSSPESVSDARRLAVETAMLYLREGKLRNLVNAPSGARLLPA